MTDNSIFRVQRFVSVIQVPIFENRIITNGVKRLNIGGKVLTNLLKEQISYRQVNMMDEFYVVEDIKVIASIILCLSEIQR